MPLDGTEQLYLERQVTLGRAILVALSLVALLETSGPSLRGASVIFLSAAICCWRWRRAGRPLCRNSTLPHTAGCWISWCWQHFCI